jgi:hypothetical protein
LRDAVRDACDVLRGSEKIERRELVAYVLPVLKRLLARVIADRRSGALVEAPVCSALWADFALVIGETLWLYRFGDRDHSEEVTGWSGLLPGRVMRVVIPPSQDAVGFLRSFLEAVSLQAARYQMSVGHRVRDADALPEVWCDFYTAALKAIGLAPT